MLALTVLVGPTPSVMAAETAGLRPFKAEFDVLENGKRIGSATLELRRSARDRWTFSTRTTGESGMAGLLGARISESSTLRETEDGTLATVDYRYEQEVAWRDRNRRLQIDPHSGAAVETDRKQRWTYATQGPVLDRHAAVLAVSLDLLRTGAPRLHAVAHKGEVEDWQFAERGSATVQTGIGTLDAIQLERVREHSKRSTVSWHARDWHYLPVVVEQVEPDGKRIRIVLKRWLQAP